MSLVNFLTTGYRTKGFYYSNSSFKANTFDLEEIFNQGCSSFLRYDRTIYLKEVRSLFFGRCYTICFTVIFVAQLIIVLFMKKRLQLKEKRFEMEKYYW